MESPGKTRILGFLWILLLGQMAALGQTTALTYQGRLSAGTNAANGKYDLVFSLFSAIIGGTTLGTPLTNSSLILSNGFFTTTLDFGAAVFTGSDRWLEIAVRTNAANAFITLNPRQKLTATPYAITAANVSGSVAGSQLTGTLPANVLSGSYPGPVVFRNASNVFSGGFSGNSGGLTNFQSTNGFGFANVINVRDFGAIPSLGGVDCTLAISNAINAQRELHWPLYFPGCPPGKFYKISGSFVYDYLPWLIGANIVQFDTGARIKVVAERGAVIVQTADQPVFVFTNGVNWVDIENLRIISAIGAANSSSPGIAFYSRLTDGQNSDDVNISQTEIEGFKYGLYSESTCILHCDQVMLMYNFWPFWLTSVNAAGVSGTRNNSVLFTACGFIENKNGGYIRGGNGVTFDSCEGGGPSQTNFLTVDGTTGLNLSLRGGNVELHHGAGVKVIGPSASAINITQEQWGLADFSNGNCWNIYSTNTDYGPRVTIDNAAVGNLPIFDCAQVHSISVQHGSVKVIGLNPYSGTFTNYFGAASSQETANLGNDYNGPGLDRAEGGFGVKYNYDFKGRTMLSYAAVSNWGVNQKVFNYPLLQYNFDLADGKIPPVGITATINVIVPGNKTNQLQFTRGVLTGVVPQ